MTDSPRQQLATLLLGRPVMVYLHGLRDTGLSLNGISVQLSDDTGGQVEVSYETIRQWFLDEGEAKR